jgi:hypothetical protein
MGRRRNPVAYPDPGIADERQEDRMSDLIMVAIGLGFFALTLGYAYACERL